jgi:periplasmic protein TonB
VRIPLCCEAVEMSEERITPGEDANRDGPVLRAGVDSSLRGDAMMLHEEGTFASLWSSVREVIFPVKLPPLVLESKPIAVVDRMATKQDPKATASAVVIYGLLILLFLWMAGRKVRSYVAPKPAAMVTELTPPVAAKKVTMMGGGGGQRGPTPVTKGQLPKFAEMQITPPKAPPMEAPKIRMPDPTVEVQKDLKLANNTMPNMGMPNSPLAGMSMGDGHGTGIGPGNGSGLGPGSGGNYGGGLRQVGGGVSPPVPLNEVTPEFSEEARKAKFMGVVTVNIVVDQHGMPQNVRLVRGVGMGLDENAMKAVKEYRFKPAMENGKPVAVQMNVVVTFQIE